MAKLNYEKRKKLEQGMSGFMLDKDEFVSRLYLNVPFIDKDIAKAMGAKWDSIVKKWYTLGNYHKFDKWNTARSELIDISFVKNKIPKKKSNKNSSRKPKTTTGIDYKPTKETLAPW